MQTIRIQIVTLNTRSLVNITLAEKVKERDKKKDHDQLRS
jgi:hypothetical protein